MKIFAPNRYPASTSSEIATSLSLFTLAFLVLALCGTASAQTTININGANGGSEFYGIGAISGGGGNSRLLMDYPTTQQSAILDYLFKPGSGASLQVLKVEIGGGSNSTDGSESTHEPTQGAINCNTGYEWWLMEQALSRNPNIKLYALPWISPGWVGGWWNNNAISYLVDYLNCAKSHGLTINYLGGFNETQGEGTASWWESLRSTLNQNGFSSTQFVGGDEFGFGIATDIAADATWASVMDFAGTHYPCNGSDGGDADTCSVTGTPQTIGKPLWQSEGGSQDYMTGAPAMIRSILRGYTDGNLVEFNNWPILAALYPGLPYDTDGLIWANSPWSGWYSVGEQTWVTAHVTQFTQPGWSFIKNASGYLNGNEQNGTYVTLKSPNGSDWSTILETTTATASQTVKIAVSGGLSTGTVEVWATNLGSSKSSDWFVQQASLTASGGSYTLTLQPDYIYSITTLATPGKSTTTIPASTTLSLPYTDAFSSYGIGKEAKYLAQLQGDFQSQPCVGQSGDCIEQVFNAAPSITFYNGNGTPWAILGDQSWSNYTVAVNALLPSSGTVFLAGRVSNPGTGIPETGVPNYFNGYAIQVGSNGTWTLYSNSAWSNPTSLASGSITAPGTNAWIALALSMNNSAISASINGKQVASVSDSSYASGQVGFGVGGWQTAQYSSLSITPAPCSTTNPIISYVQVNGASWQQTASATVSSTSAVVNLGPQPLGGGSWSWTGPNSFTSSLREIDSIPLISGTNTYTATYTVDGACRYTQAFTISTPSTNTGSVLTTPTPSSTLTSSSATFSWSTGTGVSNYKLTLGATAGGSDVYNSYTTTANSKTVSGIPTNGGTLYATLWSQIGGVWSSNAYTYTEASVSGKAVLSTPTPGSALTGSSATFTWSKGTNVTAYKLTLGTTAGGSDVYNSYTTTANSKGVSGIPTNGKTLYATLYSEISGVWSSNSYTYTEK